MTTALTSELLSEEDGLCLRMAAGGAAASGEIESSSILFLSRRSEAERSWFALCASFDDPPEPARTKAPAASPSAIAQPKVTFREAA
jgi:hypothetical protein